MAGFWGEPTADMDFCEPNYANSHYVAEFWNVISSIPIVLVGLFGVLLCRAQQLGPEQTACYALVGVVGIGSVAFHATLMRTGQVLDEVPMLWATVALCYCAYQHKGDRQRRRDEGLVPNTARLALVGGGLIIYSIAATSLYFLTGFIPFVSMFALSVAALVVLASSILFGATPAVGPRPRQLLITAACTYIGGTALLWLPGELLCHKIPLLQRLPLHALFHLTSAAGPHLGLTAFALARFDDEPCTSAPPSMRFGGLPAIERKGLEEMHKRL